MSAPTSPPATGAVFLSYAREDAAAARRIADALRGFGVEVWFDQSELRGGDTWDAKIKKQIRECALFVPLVSQQTQARPEGYFRREWLLAVERTRDMAHGVAFIMPVVIDETREGDAAVPEEFMRFHWTRLAHGVPSPQFVEQVKRLIEAPRKLAPSARFAAATPAPVASAAPRSFGIPRWLAAVAGVALLGALAYFALRPASKSPASSASPLAETKPAASPLLATSPAPATVSAADKSVAVLAFADLSEARNSEYFSDGISEELLNVLAKVPGLRVAARTSAFFFKGKNLPIGEIAAKLNVAYVVEGSVQRAGERVKITAQLIKAADGFHLWSDTFTRDAKDVFAVQEEIAGRIAKELSLKLGVSSAAATAAVNPQAFELYLLGRQAWNLRTDAGLARAEELLNRALTIDPNFARAYAALADVWQTFGSVHHEIGLFSQRDSPAAAKIRTAIDRALALDPNLAEAHASLGALLWQTWRLDEAQREQRLAISLNPNYATAHQWLGRVLASDGRLEEAAVELRRAVELDPLSHRIVDNSFIPLPYLNRAEEGLAVAERALALQPDSLQAMTWKLIALSWLGRRDEVAAMAGRSPTEGTIYDVWMVRALARVGLKADAERVYARSAAGPNSNLKYLGLAALGRTDEALAAMATTTLTIQPWNEVLFDPAFDPIRRDPRFVQLLATLGMTEAHARAQAWRAAHPPRKIP